MKSGVVFLLGLFACKSKYLLPSWKLLIFIDVFQEKTPAMKQLIVTRRLHIFGIIEICGSCTLQINNFVKAKDVTNSSFASKLRNL